MSLLAGAEVRALLADAAGRAGRYLAGLDNRPVAPDGAALAGLLGLPAGTAAVFVSGASMANTAALAAARDHQLARAGWDVQADGLFGAPELTVVIGECGCALTASPRT
jgi:hypothetical protein